VGDELMPLTSVRVADRDIQSAIGAGGIGEVYRARHSIEAGLE
jgi:hypothetical protein